MNSADRAVAVWLTAVCVVIFCMIVVGGVTRLTHSGLSMVDWRPVMGAIPPLSEGEWEAVFEDYKAYPEYQKVNQGMSLAEFKFIFAWEYGHRLLGRLIGVIFLVPFAIFYFLGKIRPEMLPKLMVAFVLGGLQGLLGWYMVKSGLVDVPRVSHYRLAAHLMLALFLIAYIFWLILDLLDLPRGQSNPRPAVLIVCLHSFTVLFCLQLVYGAFVAGMRAGLGFNTFPLMDDRLLAEAALMMQPFWINLVDNGAMVQFIHRWAGAALLVAAAGGVFFARSQGTGIRLGWYCLAAVILLQFLLGVSTLLLYVPVGIASLHQAGAVLVLLVVVYLQYVSRADSR